MTRWFTSRILWRLNTRCQLMTSEVSGETSVLHDIKSLLSRHTPRGPRTRISTFPTFRARRSDTPRQGEKSKPRQPPARFYGEWCTTSASTAYILRTARCKLVCPPGTSEVDMMPGQSGRFHGVDVFYHSPNPLERHRRRHAHRVGASVRVFYNRVRPRFLGPREFF